MNTIKTDRLFDCGPLIHGGEIAASRLRDQLDTEKAEHIVKDNLLKQYADAIVVQAHHIINLQAELESQRHQHRATMLGALLAVLLVLATIITGAVTAVPKNPIAAPPAVSECHTDSECEKLPVMEWGDI